MKLKDICIIVLQVAVFCILFFFLFSHLYVMTLLDNMLSGDGMVGKPESVYILVKARKVCAFILAPLLTCTIDFPFVILFLRIFKLEGLKGKIFKILLVSTLLLLVVFIVLCKVFRI